jgi:hypothetical protein
LEERIEDARREYDIGLGLMTQFPCPTVEWQMLKAAADVAHGEAREELRGRARLVVRGLAESIREDPLRNTLLDSKAVRELG